MEGIFYGAFKLLYEDIFQWLSTSTVLSEDFLRNGLSVFTSERIQSIDQGSRVRFLKTYIDKLKEEDMNETLANFEELLGYTSQIEAQVGKSSGQEFVFKFVESAWRSDLRTLSAKNVALSREVTK